MVSVHFEHWQVPLTADELRLVRPYFSKSEVKAQLLQAFFRSRDRVSQHDTVFNPAHILCANEAFPESAIADPLADLLIWDEWRTGRRWFPYPGRYSPLSIRFQERKTSSTSSTGVLGEIMAGVYAQAKIAPWVLVRVIGRWPDFIFCTAPDRFAYVEAKAYTSIGRPPHAADIPDEILAECLRNAIHDLAIDPAIVVWAAFTGITQIAPFQLCVRFIEIFVPPPGVSSGLPDEVADGLAERALRSAMYRIPDAAHAAFGRQAEYEGGRTRARSNLVDAAAKEAMQLLGDEAVTKRPQEAQSKVMGVIETIAQKGKLWEFEEGRRTLRAKEKASGRVLSPLRPHGASSLYIGDIDRSLKARITEQWQPDWASASLSWREVGGAPLWRCGGSIFALGSDDLDGKSIDGGNTAIG